MSSGPVDSPRVHGTNSLKTGSLVFGVVLRWCSPVSAEAESIAALSVWDRTEATRAVDRGRSSVDDPRIRKRGTPRRKSRPEHHFRIGSRPGSVLANSSFNGDGALSVASQTSTWDSCCRSNVKVLIKRDKGPNLFGHLIPREEKEGGSNRCSLRN